MTFIFSCSKKTMSTEEQKVTVEEVTEESPTTSETEPKVEIPPKVREPSPFKDYFTKLNRKVTKYKRQVNNGNITDEQKEELKAKIKCIDNMRFILKLNAKDKETINKAYDFIEFNHTIEEVQSDICKIIDEDKI